MSDTGGKPEPEIVERLGLVRQEGATYFLRKNEVLMIPADGDKADAVKVADGHFEREAGYVYLLTPSGDIGRVPLKPKEPPATLGPFRMYQGHPAVVDQPCTVHLKIGGRERERHVFPFDWAKVTGDTRGSLMENLGEATGAVKSGKMIPFAILGDTSESGEAETLANLLDCQTDGLLLYTEDGAVHLVDEGSLVKLSLALGSLELKPRSA